jgi:hypothetical protein
MATNENPAKSPPDRSEKAHQPPPPKRIDPSGDIQGDSRGEIGQFTDKGAPGVRKK